MHPNDFSQHAYQCTAPADDCVLAADRVCWPASPNDEPSTMCPECCTPGAPASEAGRPVLRAAAAQ